MFAIIRGHPGATFSSKLIRRKDDLKEQSFHNLIRKLEHDHLRIFLFWRPQKGFWRTRKSQSEIKLPICQGTGMTKPDSREVSIPGITRRGQRTLVPSYKARAFVSDHCRFSRSPAGAMMSMADVSCRDGLTDGGRAQPRTNDLHCRYQMWTLKGSCLSALIYNEMLLRG